jgi:hypothetical protein
MMAKKTKLPKKIGGVKLTKKLRKAGGKLIEQAGSPLGRELIAAGLSMAATAMTAGARREREKQATAKRAVADDAAGAAAEAGPSAAPPPPQAKPKLPNSAADPHEIGVALGNLAQDVLGRILGGKANG